MSVSFAIFTFINVWWVTLFFVLPFGVRADADKGVGYVAAPKARRWKKVVLINSLVSVVVTAIIAVMIANGAVSLKHME